jgi:hypothetical protein
MLFRSFIKFALAWDETKVDRNEGAFCIPLTDKAGRLFCRLKDDADDAELINEGLTFSLHYRGGGLKDQMEGD